MSVEGLCAICETGTVEDGCDKCGRMVCGKHYDQGTGLCTDCLKETGRRPGGDTTQPDKPDGVDEYRF